MYYTDYKWTIIYSQNKFKKQHLTTKFLPKELNNKMKI